MSTDSISNLPIVIGVPLSFKVNKKNRFFRILVLGSDIVIDPGSDLDPGERIALCEQVRALLVERLEFPRLGCVTKTALYAVEAGIAFVLEIR
jgi:hypothetical protein